MKTKATAQEDNEDEKGDDQEKTNSSGKEATENIMLTVNSVSSNQTTMQIF